MKKLLFLLLVFSLSCKKKNSEPEPEPEPVQTTTQPEIKTYCIYKTDGHTKTFLKCVTGTKDELIDVMIDLRNQNIQASSEVKTNCSVC